MGEGAPAARKGQKWISMLGCSSQFVTQKARKRQKREEDDKIDRKSGKCNNKLEGFCETAYLRQVNFYRIVIYI